MIWTLAAAVLTAGGFFVYDRFFRQEKKEETSALGEQTQLSQQGNQEKPEVTSELDQVTVTLSDYRVFKLDEMDFQFAIVRVHVKAPSAINITLDHFQTSEGITLDKVSSYVTRLEKNSYYLGKQNVWFSLISEQTETDANLFVPVIDRNATSVTVSCDFGKNADWQLDLTSHAGSANQLQYQADDVITDGNTYQMAVSSAYEITGDYMYQTVNGTDREYLLPSTTKVYAFKVEAVSLWGDSICLESAEYVPENSQETFTALDSSICSMKFDNILGREIVEKDSGYLFFVAYDPDESPVTYKGVLRLKLKDAENWITVNVDLN